MAPDWFLAVVTVGVIIIALAMLIQMGTMLGLYAAIRKAQEKVDGLVDRQVQPILDSARSITDNARTIVDDARRNVEEISSSLRAQVIKVDQVVTEATDRARLQVIRADELMADTLNRVERSVDYVERSVLAPVREVRAVIHGIGTAMGHLRRRGGRNGPERVTQDEEMFI